MAKQLAAKSALQQMKGNMVQPAYQPTKQKLIEQVPPPQELHLQKLEGDKHENEEDSGSGNTSIGTSQNIDDESFDPLSAVLQKMTKLGQDVDLNAVLSSGVDNASSTLASDPKQRRALFELLQAA